MKEFDLKKAKEGKPVCTRSGHKVRIICFDCKGDLYPIVALINKEGKEIAQKYTIEGKSFAFDRPDPDDLVMDAEKHEGWINIYKDNNVGGRIFSTFHEAVKYHGPVDYITTIKIEWIE
jgi:hypothetical protein